MPNSAPRRWRLPPPSGLRRSEGVSSARRPAKLSEVTAPARDQFAERVLDLRAQQPRAVDDLVVERCAVQLADGRRRPVRANSGPPPSEGAGATRVQSDATRRGSSVTGVVRIGPEVPGGSPTAAAASLVHTTRPDRQRSSSQVKS